MKKAIILVFVTVVLLTCMPILNTSACEIDGESGEVVMIAVPHEDGSWEFYTGNEAKSAYMHIMDQSNLTTPTDFEVAKQLSTNNEIEPRGAFSYKYRFVKKASGTKYGNAKRISNYLENHSSQTQRLQMNVSSSTSWSINVSLSGKFWEAFESFVGVYWKNTSSFSQTITMNVAPHKKAWLEFKPLLRYVSGQSQKYYIPRGPINKNPIIVESKNVYSTSPKNISITLKGKTFIGTDGAYIWKETKLK